MPIPSDYSRPIRKTAKESAFKQLQQWIIDGTLQPGEKLNDFELAKALGVSRTPIRESLQLLEVEGFVRMFPGRATEVTKVRKDTIRDLLPPLASLQALSAELAIENLTDEIIEELRETNKRFANAIQTKNYFEALKIDEEFHQIIVDTANNPYILKILASLQAHVRRLFFNNSIALAEESIEEHNQIIELMKSKLGSDASTIMKRNWLRTLEAFE